MWLAVHPPDRSNAPAGAATLHRLRGGGLSSPCSEPGRLRNALISPARQQPLRTSRACVKPRQRGAVPGGQDGVGGRSLRRSGQAGSVPGRESFTPHNHRPRLGHPQLREGSRTDGGGQTIFFPLCICTMPSSRHRVCEVPRTKAGGRLYSAHTSYLRSLGRKEPFVWKQQLLPQNHAWGVCAGKSRRQVQKPFCTKGHPSPPAVTKGCARREPAGHGESPCVLRSSERLARDEIAARGCATR